MATYQLGENLIHDANDPEHQALLGAFHAFGGRPLCLCKSPAVEMYIAHIDTGVYVVKRMPNSATTHSPSCEHFEVPLGLSGLAQVKGSAIKESQADQCVDLKFDFVMSKVGTRPPRSESGSEKDSVAANPNRLTLRGLLHYLWEEAGFNRWVPRMQGKRNWFVVRKYLLAAAEGKRSAAGSLVDLLYVPAVYVEAQHKMLAQTRLSLLAKAAQSTGKGQKLMLAIGLLDRFDVGPTGRRLYLEHAPDFPMLVAEDLYRRLNKRFSIEFGLRDFCASSHMVAILTLWVDIAGVAHVDQISIMMVTENWIPFESSFESALFDELTLQNRSYIRGMRYNLSSDKVIATCILTDSDTPVALLVNNSATHIDQLASDIPYPVWTWSVTKEAMPALPAPGRA